MLGFLGNHTEDIKVLPDTKLLEAMRTLDKGAKGIVLVVDTNNKLIGLVTDGDIRRSLLKNKSLDIPVQEVMTKNFKSCTDKNKALHLMKKMSIAHMPIVNEQNTLLDLAVFSEIVRSKTAPETAVVMAGGLGTRLYPLTKETPKPMLMVAHKPMLEWIIEGLKSHGVKNVILSIRDHQVIKDHFGDGSKFGVNITYLIENEVKGTAGALSLLKEQNKPFIVMNGDILTTINYYNLYNKHIKTESAITVVSYRKETKIEYGVLELEGTDITGLIEKPSIYHQINAGIYVLSPHVLEHIPKKGAYTMPELIDTLIEKNMKVSAFPIMEFWLDIGHHKDFKYAQEAVLDFMN